MQSPLGRLLYSIYKWWECGRKRLIELPKIPLGNWAQLPIVSILTWVLRVLIDVFPVTHPVSLETFLPSHNLFHFQFCWSVVYESGLGVLWDCIGLFFPHLPRNILTSLQNIKKVRWACVYMCVYECVHTYALLRVSFTAPLVSSASVRKRKLFSGTLLLPLKLQHRVIRILLQLIKGRDRFVIGRSNLLRHWSGVRSYHKSFYFEPHNKP